VSGADAVWAEAQTGPSTAMTTAAIKDLVFMLFSPKNEGQ
jgi:hypothetical protein